MNHFFQHGSSRGSRRSDRKFSCDSLTLKLLFSFTSAQQPKLELQMGEELLTKNLLTDSVYELSASRQADKDAARYVARQSVRGGTAEAIAAATGLKVFQHQCSRTAPPHQDRNLPSTHSPPAEHRQAERSNRSCARPMSELEPSEAAADRDRKTRSVYLQRERGPFGFLYRRARPHFHVSQRTSCSRMTSWREGGAVASSYRAAIGGPAPPLRAHWWRGLSVKLGTWRWTSISHSA
ncbi:hypothetical protein SRHO_G00262880 [Serrasalmus rhombeus]